MPAKNLNRKDEKGIYSHIYNKGVEKRIIFNDEEDFAVFISYLKDYLSAPQNPESLKQEFMVHGRSFRGTPHQPKNYFNKVELIAYSLMPDRFHLLLCQKTRGSLENFLRSLCTRYSMYFNKKYRHAGALFEGPYKSAEIEDESRLLHLTRCFHHTGSHSSYAEYLGERETSWVKPKKGTGDYKDFVEKYELDQKEKELIKGIASEDVTQHLESYPPEPAESSDLKPLQRVPELLATTAVFLLLLTLGIRNIMFSTAKSPGPSPAPSVLSKTEEIEDIQPKMLTVKIDGATSVNIRQKPTTDSEKIGQAKDGDTFEFVSIDSGWYEVKLPDGSTGFISATSAVIKEPND